VLHQLAFARLPNAVKDGPRDGCRSANPPRSPVNPARPILHARSALLLPASHSNGPLWLFPQHRWSIVVVRDRGLSPRRRLEAANVTCHGTSPRGRSRRTPEPGTRNPEPGTRNPAALRAPAAVLAVVSLGPCGAPPAATASPFAIFISAVGQEPGRETEGELSEKTGQISRLARFAKPERIVGSWCHSVLRPPSPIGDIRRPGAFTDVCVRYCRYHNVVRLCKLFFLSVTCANIAVTGANASERLLAGLRLSVSRRCCHVTLASLFAIVCALPGK
jgi:hypothetical protein